MEKTLLQMPIGYRFCPTDEEIIIHYLRPKVFNFPLPAATAILHHHHLFHHHPAALLCNPKEKKYFFSKLNDINIQHPTYPSNGYWKPTNINNDNLILATGCNHPIGFKKTFVFYQFSDGAGRPGCKSPWILQQFRLLYPLPIKMEEWVVCSIHMKSKRINNLHQFPAKKLKKFHSNNVKDDGDSTSSSVITFNDDLNDEKDYEEEESKVN